MQRTVIEDMQEKTLEWKHLFDKNNPLFTVCIPSIGKMSMLAGFESVKMFFQEQDPTTIDLREREFPVIQNGEIVGNQDIWTLEFDGNVVFVLRNNKIMNRGQIAIMLRRIGFAN